MTSWTSRLAVLGIVAVFWTGCGLLNGATVSSACPPWPEAGPKVAEELEEIPFEGHEDFWSWMSRLDKLRDQLAACDVK